MYGPRQAFTLIELLVAISIIGMLMALTAVAIYGAMRRAREAKIGVEIDQLAQALQGYKEKRIQYAPCMGNSTLTNRQSAIVRHMQVAFPNVGSNYTSYANMRTLCGGYNFVNSSGTFAGLDLNYWTKPSRWFSGSGDSRRR